MIWYCIFDYYISCKTDFCICIYRTVQICTLVMYQQYFFMRQTTNFYMMVACKLYWNLGVTLNIFNKWNYVLQLIILRHRKPCVYRNHFEFINVQKNLCDLETISNLIFHHLKTLWKHKHKRPLEVTSKFQYMHTFMH